MHYKDSIDYCNIYGIKLLKIRQGIGISWCVSLLEHPYSFLKLFTGLAIAALMD